jgi:hypothetical protein
MMKTSRFVAATGRICGACLPDGYWWRIETRRIFQCRLFKVTTIAMLSFQFSPGACW